MTRSLLKKLLLILVFLSFPVTTVSIGVLPLKTPEHEFVYDRLERVDALSLTLYDYQLGPYRLDTAFFRFGPFEYLASLSPHHVRLFGCVAEDYASAKNASPSGFESFRGGLVAQPYDKLFIYANFLLDERKAKDPDYPGKKWRGLAGGVENAFIYYCRGPLELTLGRFASFWGPRNSLCLSGNAAMDGFGYTLHWGHLALSYRLARLDNLSRDDGGGSQFENRFFAGHRLDLHLNQHLRIGVFETAIFGGSGRQIDLYYLNPIIFYHASQLNEGVDDNTFLGTDFSYKPKEGWKLYGQLLVDDFQIDDREKSDQEPNEIAWLIGSYVADLVSGWDLKAEYSRVANRTFNQLHERNRYLIYGELIGGALGNDYDLWRLRVTRWQDDNLAGYFTLSQKRQGEGQVATPWTAPWLLSAGEYDESFPSGVVQKTISASVGVKSFLVHHVYVNLEGGVDWVKNQDNRPGETAALPFFHVVLSSFFSHPLAVD